MMLDDQLQTMSPVRDTEERQCAPASACQFRAAALLRCGDVRWRLPEAPALEKPNGVKASGSGG